MQNFTQITPHKFEAAALKLFRYQAQNIPVYVRYLNYLNIDYKKIKHTSEIPFLPIDFFKTHSVLHQNKQAETTFLSSGTSNTSRSKHHVADLNIYEKSFLHTFEYFYGDVSKYCIQALLPSYIENGNSSLIYMINFLIKKSSNPLSDFVSEEQLLNNIKKLKHRKVLLIGVSYALLDLAEKKAVDLSHCIVMETGGMKGRRKEWTRTELHKVLQKQFNVASIHSEYGMTELLSQAYSKGNGIFESTPWLKISTRPLNEPFSTSQKENSGIIKVIDLANIYSCAFIETADVGKIHSNGSFEILGRIDFEDIRGCNLMIAD